MFGRSKLLIVIPAIVLIPILLGMTPLNFIQKIGSGCPVSHSKQVRCNPCPFHSFVSQDDPSIVSLNSTPLEQASLNPFDSQVLGLDSFRSSISLSALPLRC
jgi:hypothetical protein